MWFLTIFLLLLKQCYLTSSEPQIIELLNTDTTKWNDWVKNTGKYEGWRSQNIPPNGKLVYGLCSPISDVRENWIRSPFIRREDAISINIEISFTMKSCHGRPETKFNCEETFRLMMYEADEARDVPSSWSDRIYTTVSVVSPNIKWTDSRIEENIVNTKTFKIESKRKGIFIALKDTGACVMVENIKIFYIACPTTTFQFADYPMIVVSHGYDIRSAKGKCVNGASLIEKYKMPHMLCQPNGNWHLLDTAFCKCDGGFTPSTGKMRCINCPPNTFKPYPGSDKCLYCPKNSYSNPGSLQCTCNLEYHPIISQSNSLKCAQYPSKPRNLQCNETNEGQLLLTWIKPIISGEEPTTNGHSNLRYKIKCTSCSEFERLKFSPADETKETSIIVDTLESGRSYHFSVTAFNQFMLNLNLSQNPASSEKLVYTTKKADSGCVIEQVTVHQSKETEEVIVSWKKPSFNKIQGFQVIMHEMTMDNSNPSDLKLKPLNPIIINTKINQCNFPYKNSKTIIYRLKVRARTTTSWGPFSLPLILNLTKSEFLNNKLNKRLPGVTYSDSWNSNRIIILVLFGSGFTIMAVTLILCLYCKYITPKKHKKKKTQQKGSIMSIDLTNYSQIDVPISITKVYIDPSNYEDPSSILQEFTNEIDPRKIQIERVIGEGEFGDVCKGQLFQNSPKHGIHVAIKTLKSNCSEKEKINFLLEAGIMGQFTHTNVIKLEGVVTNTEPVMILTQYMENGSLDSFLRKKKNQFSLLQLLGMLRGICSGMRYLSDMHYVHRDLAARNILVDSQLCCKVSDFGLSREIISDTTEGAYTTKGGLIPIRWTAPEAINYRRFTSSSDVWSFGVVMWEMMSYGDRPYWNWANKDVLQAIESGYRLPAPRNCSPAIHLLMLDCWTYERSERPKFAQVLLCIDSFIRNPEALSVLRQSRSLSRLSHNNQQRSSLQSHTQRNNYVLHSSQPLNIPLIPATTLEPVFGPESSISHWLECLGLPNYKETFANHNLSFLIQISKFTTTDLLALGINQLDHVNKIVNNIRAMQNYFEISVTQPSVL